MDTIAAYNKLHQMTHESLIKTHAPLVKKIARHILARLPPNVAIEDLLQVGMMGLLEAARLYNKDKGASFETYALIRIRGHMLDEIRQNDWVPRSVHRDARLIADTVKHLEHRLGREVKAIEIADELGISLKEYYELVKTPASNFCQGYDDLGITDDVMVGEIGRLPEPHTKAMADDIKVVVAKLMDQLPKTERLVLSLYYERDLNFKEIAEVLEVSESRVCQIHTKATARLKTCISPRPVLDGAH